MNFKPRDYQDQIAKSVFKEWESVTSTLVVAPTGTGKTCIFAMVIEKMQPKRAMVIAAQRELIWQARDKIKAVTGLECSIEMGELWTDKSLFGSSPVVVSSIQTQSSKHGDRKRMSRFKPEDFGLLIIDECDASVAPTYRNLINYYTQNPNLKIVGVTATPDRCDEEALGQIFQSVAFDYEILDAIHDGWLVPVHQQFVATEIDFSQMRTTAGDLNGADLAKVMELERNLQGVAIASLEISFGLPLNTLRDHAPEEWQAVLLSYRDEAKRTICFTSSVRQAEALSSIFNRVIPNISGWVCGKTNEESRRELLQRFQDGKVQIVCNCGVLARGYDNPGVELIVMARPTKSRALYAQLVGRGIRPLPRIVDLFDTPEERRKAIAESAKPNCTILDFVGNSGRHRLMSSADILGGKVSDDVLDRAVERAKKLGQPVNMAQLIDEEEERKKQEQERKLAEDRRRLEAASKRHVLARVTSTSKTVNPFDAFDLQPARDRGWDYEKQLSTKQKALLLKQGINPDEISYAQGRQLIAEQFRRWKEKLCTLKQAQCLKKYGYDTKEMSMQRASQLIDALARNHWKRPVEEPQPAQKDRVPF